MKSFIKFLGAVTGRDREICFLALPFIAVVNPGLFRFSIDGFKFYVIFVVGCFTLLLVNFTLWLVAKDKVLAKLNARHGTKMTGTPEDMLELIGPMVRPSGLSVLGAVEDFFFVGVPVTIMSVYGYGSWVTVAFAALFAAAH